MNSTCGSPQVATYKGSTLYWRSDPWPWQTSLASSSTSVSNMGFKYDFVNNKEVVSYAYFFDDPSIISRVMVDSSGLHQILMWNDGDLHWKEFYSAPKYQCDNYGHCGAYGKCGPQPSDDNVDNFECTCLPGYEPKSPKDWYHRDGSEGCVRKKSGLSMCGSGDGFVKLLSVNIDGMGTRCLAWYGELMDNVEYSYEVWDLNVRVDAKELEAFSGC
nr:g-type lectin s-receptor-like serine/threonine-protein kinase rks1 [Quercus suber]